MSSLDKYFSDGDQLEWFRKAIKALDDGDMYSFDKYMTKAAPPKTSSAYLRLAKDLEVFEGHLRGSLLDDEEAVALLQEMGRLVDMVRIAVREKEED